MLKVAKSFIDVSLLSYRCLFRRSIWARLKKNVWVEINFVHFEKI